MSKFDNDDFGQRMKSYEFHETTRKFIPLLPIYARIDGRSFSKFTKGLDRPYDTRLTNALVDVTKYIVKETNAKIGFCQSDELSFCWLADKYDSEIFFDGKIMKMTSVLASMATTKFMHILMNHEDKDFAKYADKLPQFDCRVFSMPNKTECANVFLWREMDACKNAISMAASHYYSHKELDGKNGAEKQEMLFQKGVNFNDYPSMFRRGQFVRRENVEITLTPEELDSIPEKHRPNGPVIRSKVVEIEMPIFSKVTNRVEVVFDGAKPLTA